MNTIGTIFVLLFGGLFLGFLIFQLIHDKRDLKEFDEQIRKSKINVK